MTSAGGSYPGAHGLALAAPGLGDHGGAVCAGDVGSSVGGGVVDHHDLVDQ